ncbi:MAG: ComEC/Rec2 family competence protein [Acholeplasmataceae bacterium]|nr:ComEC/Rec2 family competence protein [Acholeplasmataceae bacterium]
MRKLKTILPYNYFHYYAFIVLIVLLGHENIIGYLLLIPFIYLIKGYSKKWVVVTVGLFGYLFVEFSDLPKQPPENNVFQVVNLKEYDSFNRYIVTENNNKYVFLSKDSYHIGDYVDLNYTYQKFEAMKFPGGFNEKNYYASQKIFYELNVKSSKLIKKGFHFNQIPYKLKRYFKDYDEPSKSYIYGLVFSDNIFEPDFKESLASLGISHLFALSGVHISFLILVLGGLLDYFNIKKKNLIIVLFISLYVFLTGFPISLLRAFIMHLSYLVLNKKGLTRLDSLSLSFVLLLLINPFYRYSYSFILTFLVTFFIVIMKPKKGFKGILLIQITSFFASLLIVSNLNGGIYLKGLIFGFFYVIIFPCVLMPLVGLSMIKPLSFMINPLLNGFNLSIYYSSTTFKIKMPHVSLLIIGIYMGLFVFLLLCKTFKQFITRSLIIGGFILGIYLYPHIDLSDTVYFLDVSQGDSTYIKGSFDSCNILIDAHRGTSDFLDGMGDVKIDYFFITHGDYDHCSEALKIVENHSVKRVYTNPYDNSDYINELKPFGLKRVSNERITCGKIQIEVLGPLKNYKNSNDNSLVLKIVLPDKTILLTGDISSAVEQELISVYKQELKSDILHISHHGSRTSTSSNFLKYVEPKQAIISVGKNNYYGHPSNEVIWRLKQENIEILLTSEERTIIFKKYNHWRDSFYYTKHSFL